jgi:putative transposase
LAVKIEYHNLYSHIILITKNRYPFINEAARIRIEKYITGVVGNHQSRLYAIYANPEHVHMLISRAPVISEQELAGRIADSSKKFIAENQLCAANFQWQESASAFSVSKSDVDRVCKYILNQKAHHRKFSFQEEYDSFIKHYQQTLRWEMAT